MSGYIEIAKMDRIESRFIEIVCVCTVKILVYQSLELGSYFALHMPIYFTVMFDQQNNVHNSSYALVRLPYFVRTLIRFM